MRTRLIVIAAVLLAAVCVSTAGIEIDRGDINLHGDPMELGGRPQWHIKAKVGNTGTARFYTYAGETAFDPTPYTVTFHAGPSVHDAGTIEIAASTVSNTYVEFTFTTNNLAYPFGTPDEPWYSAIKFVSGSVQVSSPEGLISCSGAPEIDGGSVSFTYNRDWSLWRYSNATNYGPSIPDWTTLTSTTNSRGQAVWSLLGSLPAISANINMGGYIATNYGTPSAADHVIDQGYADARYINTNESGVTLSGTFSGTLSGDGSGVTNLNGTEIRSGTVADARIAATLGRDTERIAATNALDVALRAIMSTDTERINSTNVLDVALRAVIVSSTNDLDTTLRAIMSTDAERIASTNLLDTVLRALVSASTNEISAALQSQITSNDAEIAILNTGTVYRAGDTMTGGLTLDDDSGASPATTYVNEDERQGIIRMSDGLGGTFDVIAPLNNIALHPGGLAAFIDGGLTVGATNPPAGDNNLRVVGSITGDSVLMEMDDAAGTNCKIIEWAIGGNQNSNGNWRMSVVSSNLSIDVRVAGVWTNAWEFTRP